MSANFSSATHAAQITSHRSLRHCEAKFLEFAVDLRSAPTVVLFGQTTNEIPDFVCDPESSAAPSRTQAPIPAESSAMPTTTVSGLTMSNTFFERDQNRRSVIQNKRSDIFRLARGRFRLRTATCCRRARISIARSVRDRKYAATSASSAKMQLITDHPRNMAQYRLTDSDAASTSR